MVDLCEPHFFQVIVLLRVVVAAISLSTADIVHVNRAQITTEILLRYPLFFFLLPCVHIDSCCSNALK